jgi:hypothetical protein
MIYLKSALVGIAVAVMAAILWLLAESALTAIMVSREMARTTGSGGIGAVSVPSYALVGACLGFAVGFMWNVRRLRKKSIHTP